MKGWRISKNSPEELNTEHWDIESAKKEISKSFQFECEISDKEDEALTVDGLVGAVSEQIITAYKKKAERIGSEDMKKIEGYLYLQIIDQSWKEHLLAMDTLKESVSLRSYGQRDPLQEYKKEAFTLFSSMIEGIEEESILTLIRMPSPENIEIEDDTSHDDAIDDLTFTHPSAPVKEPEKIIDPRDSIKEESPQSQVTTFRREGEKVGRNDPCPCSSGKKYKKCCGKS